MSDMSPWGPLHGPDRRRCPRCGARRLASQRAAGHGGAMRALKYIVVGLLATLVLGPIGLGLVILAAILRRGKS